MWPGEFHGLYSPWGREELDTTEQLSLSLFIWYIKPCTFVRSLGEGIVEKKIEANRKS